MRYLLDTNIFLEILLRQDKSEECKLFLDKNKGNMCLSDFALHSVGVILFRNKLQNVFDSFLRKFVPNFYILTLDKNKYSSISSNSIKYNLDFDDAYQLTVSDNFNLTFVTLDLHFKLTSKFYKIIFL